MALAPDYEPRGQRCRRRWMGYRRDRGPWTSSDSAAARGCSTGEIDRPLAQG